MSWSREDIETKPRLDASVIAAMERARAVAKSEAADSGNDRSNTNLSSEWMPSYKHLPLSIDIPYSDLFTMTQNEDDSTGNVSDKYIEEMKNLFSQASPLGEVQKAISDTFPPTVSSREEKVPSLVSPTSNEEVMADLQEPSAILVTPPPKKKKRTRRKRTSSPKQEDREYVDEPLENDVLSGRGGKTNHHLGNKRYLNEVLNLRDWYRSSEKQDKTAIAQNLVDVIHLTGGRFLKKDEKNGKWFILKNIDARKKASQALREHMTQEEREAAKVATCKPAMLPV